MAELSADALRGLMAAGALEALARSAEHLMGRAVELAPIDEGTLRGSAAVVLIVNGSRFEGEGSLDEAKVAAATAARLGVPLRLDAEVSFSTVYAARQHEELDWRHPKGGQAKYLSQPLEANAARYRGIIQAGALAAMRRGHI